MTAVVAFVTGVVSVYSSTSGVVLPAFLPTVPGLVERLGGLDPIAVASAMNVGSHLVDLSPLSTTGALCLAGVPAGVDSQGLFNKLLAWGLSMTVVGAILCWLMFGKRTHASRRSMGRFLDRYAARAEFVLVVTRIGPTPDAPGPATSRGSAMRQVLLVGVTVAVCAAAAMQIQVNAQQGGGRGVAAGGTTAGAGRGYPTPEQYASSKEAQAHVAKAKSIAGSDAKLLMRFENTCGALGPQRPALEAQNAGQKPEPPRPVEPVQIFDNLWYFGFNTIGAWAIQTSDGIIMIDALNTVQEAETIIEPSLKKGGARSGERQVRHRRSRSLRSFRRRAVLPGQVQEPNRDERAGLGPH